MNPSIDACAPPRGGETYPGRAFEPWEHDPVGDDCPTRGPCVFCNVTLDGTGNAPSVCVDGTQRHIKSTNPSPCAERTWDCKRRKLANPEAYVVIGEMQYCDDLYLAIRKGDFARAQACRYNLRKFEDDLLEDYVPPFSRTTRPENFSPPSISKLRKLTQAQD